MRFALFTLFLLLAGCGPSRSARISMAIEDYCTAQAARPMRPEVPARSPGAPCTESAACDSDTCAFDGVEGYCTTLCTSDAECPTFLPHCVAAGGFAVCTATCNATPVSACVTEWEARLDQATAARCLPELDALTACLAGGAPFCGAEADAACGVEQGRYDACDASP